jgi:diketogulonate reductase-like aldo/keto reductase
VQPPSYLYGTAWKEDATESCVVAALSAGFRGIDTANQRKHYHEEGVGRGIADWLRSGGTRDQLYLQTKFTFRDGQDHRLPYDEHAPIATQVKQSFESSLVHLGITYLDSLVLHGPSQGGTLGRLDHEAWRAMEALVDTGQVGVSR